MAMRRGNGREALGGFTVIEMLVALLISTVVVLAAFTTLSSQLQLYTVQNEKQSVQVSLRTAASVLSFALMEASTSGGDLTAISDSSITMRAIHGSGMICAKVIGSSVTYGIHQVSGRFDVGDSIMGHDVGDNEWDVATMNKSKPLSDTPNCQWGDTTSAPAPDIAVELAGSASVTDSLYIGSSVRAFHTVEFILRAFGSVYGIAQQIDNSGTYEALAGPMMSFADSGLVFSYYDSLGAVTTTAGDVATVDILLKAQSRRSLQSVSSNSGRLADTLRVRVNLRN